MVRLINDSNIDMIANAVYSMMRLQEIFTHIKDFNNPNLKSCIYVMWHANMCLIHGIADKPHTSVLISNSIDGEVIARAVEKWGFKVVRGSTNKKGAVESTMQMLARLKDGESVAIMVDGPSGPLHKVKNGALKLAQKSGKPIVPIHWYCPQFNFVHLPSWDRMTTPIGDCKILNVYGEPLYIKADADDEEINRVREQIKTTLLDLEAKAPELYKEAKKQGLWEKQN